MEKEQVEIIRAINFLKGLVIGFNEHKKEDFIFLFLDSHKEMLSEFEKSQILSYALRTNEHTKQLTLLFMEAKYNPDNDTNSYIEALNNNHYKSAKLILEQGYNPNKLVNNKNIVSYCLDKIHLRASNTTLKKVNKLLHTLDISQLSYQNIEQLNSNIEKARRNLIILNREFPQFTQDIVNDFSLFEEKYNIVYQSKKLDCELSKSLDVQPKTSKRKI